MPNAVLKKPHLTWNCKVDTQPVHHPVLVKEVLALFEPVAQSGWILDATCGLGGHSEAILKAFPKVRVLGIDQDPAAISIARKRLSVFGDRFDVVHENFENWQTVVQSKHALPLNGVLADLGFSSMQIDDPSRGFSFRLEGPLDMRMNPQDDLTAWDLLNRMNVRELTQLFFRLGEEPRAGRIARGIKEALHDGTLKNQSNLVAQCIRDASGYHHSRRDASTKVFQALRIAVNRELDVLDQFLSQLPGCISQGGHIGVISFHSLEDRKVKNIFRSAEHDLDSGVRAWGERLHSKGVIPTEEECEMNPRARSARLRTLKCL